MRLQAVTIKDFKRFADLSVRGIPATARLIILTGPNGIGKSSFIEALHTWSGWRSERRQHWDTDYHGKVGGHRTRSWGHQVALVFHDPQPSDLKKALYIRSAYRNEAEFRISSLQSQPDPLSAQQVPRLIDNDAAVRRNYQRLSAKGLEDLYEQGQPDTTFRQYRDTHLGTIRDALHQLFPDLTLDSLGNPLTRWSFSFTKGTSSGFNFKNLSGGEKAAFDIILDMAIAVRDYDDTIFCIDEPEAHLHSRLHADLLTALLGLLPQECQLLLATHSIGMIRRARDLQRETPGSVAFLDFGQRDYDSTQTMEPASPDRRFWSDVYEVALGDLAALVAPEGVVICEGASYGSGPNHSHDARCYDRIFATEFPDTRFIAMGNAHEVVTDKWELGASLRLLCTGIEIVRVIDRDDRSSEEVAGLPAEVRVLSRRNLECYLWDDEILRALATSRGNEGAICELLEAKRSIVAGCVNMGKPPDDLKPASGSLYLECKRRLGITQGGNDARTFMRDTLAPLVTPATGVYEELRNDIFGGQT